MVNAIEVRGLRKRFGETEALAGVDLSVEPGSVVGLLGPNGAGKTTIVRVLATLIVPDGGSATVAGFDVVDQAAQVRERLGLTGQFAAVDEALTGRENLVWFARLRGLSRHDATVRAGELLEMFDLAADADRPAKGYSGGMRRRLDLAASLVVEPEVLVLDEPTTGLDPRSRLDLWEQVRALRERGVTVLLTTQYLEEADQLADRIVVLDQGRVIAEGTARQLKGRVGGSAIEVVATSAADLDAITKVVASIAGADPHVEHEVLRVSAPVTDGVAAIAALVEALRAEGVGVEDVAVRRPSLDDVFLALTGHVAEAADPAHAVAESDAVGS